MSKIVLKNLLAAKFILVYRVWSIMFCWYCSYLAAGVAEDDRLGDGEGIIQITESLQLPFLHFYRNVELFNTFQCKLEYKQQLL